jgi:hypothetical protein
MVEILDLEQLSGIQTATASEAFVNKYKFKLTDDTADGDATIVALMTVESDGLLVRFFRRVGGDVTANSETIPSVVSPSVGLTPVADRVIVSGSLLSDSQRVTGGFYSEVERQFFSPSVQSNFGNAELDDYTAVVLPVQNATFAACAPYSHFVESKNVKASVRRLAQIKNQFAHIVLVSLQSQASLSNWTLLRLDMPSIFLVDRTPGNWISGSPSFSVFDVLPTVTLDAPQSVGSAEWATVGVQLVDNGVQASYTGELHLEVLSGRANKLRVPITNGAGSFKVNADGLDTGDHVKIKIGTKNVSGLASATIQVA